MQVAVTPVGAEGLACERLSPELPEWSATFQLEAAACGARPISAAVIPRRTHVGHEGLARFAIVGDPIQRDQLVHESVAGLVVGVAEPPVAVTPVREGIEK